MGRCTLPHKIGFECCEIKMTACKKANKDESKNEFNWLTPFFFHLLFFAFYFISFFFSFIFCKFFYFQFSGKFVANQAITEAMAALELH